MRTFVLVLVTIVGLPLPLVSQNVTLPTAETARANLHYRLGWESLHSEAWASAMKEFQQAIDIDKTFRLAYYGLGRSYMGLKQFRDAAAAYEACRNLYQSQASRKFTNSQDADRMRQEDQQQLDVAIQASTGRGGQNSQQVSNHVRQLRTQMERIQMKRDQARDVSLDTVAPAFVSLALGSAYFRQERMQDAEREYKAALSDDPKAAEAHNNLAVLFMLTGRLDESLKEVTLAEKSGFHVNAQFKKDLEAKRKAKT
jgi:tetratricopeptide (TPR) repeat protein